MTMRKSLTAKFLAANNAVRAAAAIAALAITVYPASSQAASAVVSANITGGTMVLYNLDLASQATGNNLTLQRSVDQTVPAGKVLLFREITCSVISSDTSFKRVNAGLYSGETTPIAAYQSEQALPTFPGKVSPVLHDLMAGFMPAGGAWHVELVANKSFTSGFCAVVGELVAAK